MSDPTYTDLPDSYFEKDSDTLANEAIKEAREGWWTKSMETLDERLTWWRDSRLGCFVHWGAYTALNGVWQGKIHGGYGEHIQRVSKINQADYGKYAVEQFNPTGFDADEWISLVKAAGFKSFVITAKHHDGFAMFKSGASSYNIVDASPFKRDPMQELKAACDKYDIKFGFYYSHAFDWGEEFGLGNDWEFENPGGNRFLKGGHDWWDECPELRRIVVENYVNGKAIPQILELIHNYDPDILWFDTSHKLPFHENLRILKVLREAGPEIIVNGRLARTGSLNFGDYINTGDRAAEFTRTGGDWESIPTTNESYGHNPYDKRHKPVSFFVTLFAKAISRNGNILMNIGPMGDGRIDPVDVSILRGVGDWIQENGASIHGCGPSGLPIQDWGVTTRRDSTVYLHVTNWPSGGELVVGGLKSDPTEVSMLVGGEPVPWTRINDLDIELQLAAPDPSDGHLVVEMRFDTPIQTDPVRRLSGVGPVRLLAFDAERLATPFNHQEIANGPQEEIDGEIEERVAGTIAEDAQELLKGDDSLLGYGDGKVNLPKYFVSNWVNTNQWLEWTLRLEKTTNYNVLLKLSPGVPNGGGEFTLDMNGTAFTASVPENLAYETDCTLTFGEVELAKGMVKIRLRANRIGDGELMRPLELILYALG